MQTRSQTSQPRVQAEKLTGVKTRSQTADDKTNAKTSTWKKGIAKDVHTVLHDEDTEFVFNISILSNSKEPKGICKALRSKEGHDWHESAQQEFQNFLDQSSWIVTSRGEAAKHKKTIIGSKWVFKKQLQPNGRTRFKLRIVSKGYQQVQA